MATINERAHRAEKEWLLSDDVTRYGFEQGYIQGATEQHKIDIDKACSLLDALYVDVFGKRIKVINTEVFRKLMED